MTDLLAHVGNAVCMTVIYRRETQRAHRLLANITTSPLRFRDMNELVTSLVLLQPIKIS